MRHRATLEMWRGIFRPHISSSSRGSRREAFGHIKTRTGILIVSGFFRGSLFGLSPSINSLGFQVSRFGEFRTWVKSTHPVSASGLHACWPPAHLAFDHAPLWRIWAGTWRHLYICEHPGALRLQRRLERCSITSATGESVCVPAPCGTTAPPCLDERGPRLAWVCSLVVAQGIRAKQLTPKCQAQNRCAFG